MHDIPDEHLLVQGVTRGEFCWKIIAYQRVFHSCLCFSGAPINIPISWEIISILRAPRKPATLCKCRVTALRYERNLCVIASSKIKDASFRAYHNQSRLRKDECRLSDLVEKLLGGEFYNPRHIIDV